VTSELYFLESFTFHGLDYASKSIAFAAWLTKTAISLIDGFWVLRRFITGWVRWGWQLPPP